MVQVEESSVELRAASRGLSDWRCVSLLTDSSVLVNKYEQYCCLFSNFIASSTLDQCAAHLRYCVLILLETVNRQQE
jgi:hypothetical protein